MKKLDKRWLFFLLLILVLATGLPYLSLYQEAGTTKVENSADEQVMSIALVNEDEGADFNGETLTFGESFVRGLDNNDDHNWFVVSRGVAESGLNQSKYDMMIVIPNDFSEKALSIEANSPEQVVLNYRINASDNEYVRAEAERTASTILNDFNRQIIDVYFASIIGNLQDAQDNIATIIDKQVQHTSSYNNNINYPLSNYTNQFGAIKGSTQLSRDSFGGLEELVTDFEGRLVEGVDYNRDYLAELDNFTSMKDMNSSELLRFNESLLQFNHIVDHSNREQNFEQLLRTNDWINNQFKIADKHEQINIALQTALLSKRLDASLEKITSTNHMVQNRLEGLDKEVTGKVLGMFKGIWKEQEEFLADLFQAQDEIVKESILREISQLPSMNETEFEDIGLPGPTVKEIQNVIAIARVFDDRQDKANYNQEGFLPKYLENLKKHLSETGVMVTDTVWIPANEKEGQKFTLQLPDEYTLTKLELQYPGRSMVDYTEQYLESGELLLEPNEAGNFTTQISLKLANSHSNIDVFEPVQIGWELEHQYIEKEEIDVPNEENEEGSSGNKEPESISNNDDTDTEKAEVTVDTDASEESESESKDDSETGVLAEPDDDNVEEPSDDGDNEGEEDDTDGRNDNESAQKIEKLYIFNNRIHHEIVEPVHKMDHATKGLVNMVNQTINPYQKLYSTFDKYLGTEAMQMDTNTLKRMIRKEGFKLRHLAADHSLYKFFNDPNVNDLITGSIVNQVVRNVYNQINEPLANLQSRIDNHQMEIDHTKSEADLLAERVVATEEQAKDLNNHLGETLEQVSNWREQSMELLESYGVIEQNDGEEQTAMLTLHNGFQSLLSESQSITEQAQGTVHGADTVYQTLDHIDSQADDIADSGVNLVEQADELSKEMTEKVLEDQEFVDNFSGVLANSRVGDRQNDNLYHFLSNPVQTSNEGVITSGTSFTLFYLVFTMFIVALFTAYAISTLQQKRKEADSFAEDTTLMTINAPITFFTVGVGALEGIVIGIISSMLLHISDARMVLWVLVIIGLMIGMLLFATYLFRQLKMLGMFILLLVMSMYIFLTNAFGGGITDLAFLNAYSPLQYADRLLIQIIQGDANYWIALLIIGGVILISILGNLLVVNKAKEGDLENEDTEEAS